MNRTAPLLAVFVLLVAGVALPVAGAVTDSTGSAGQAPQAGTPTPTSNGSAEAPAPGALLAGVVDVQEAEVESELEGRAFGIKVARANSDASRATVVAEQVEELNQRTESLRERERTLVEARENGSITRARYEAEMAALAARTGAVQRQLDRTQTASNDLPADLLESKGVNATAIETLRNESRTVAANDTASIARSIAGPGAGDGLGRGTATPGLPTTNPGQNGTEDGSGILPGTDGFDTPTVPGSPDLPGGDNDTSLPTPPNGTDLPTDDVGDAVSSIVGGSDGGGGSNESDSGSGSDGSDGSDDGILIFG